MNNEIEKELKELQLQYDKVCHERNELKKENTLLKRDLKDYQKRIKKGVEEHYKEFMSGYDVLLEEYEQLINNNQKLKKIIKANFGYDKGFTYCNQVFFNYNAPVMEEEIKEVLENE